MEYDPALFRAVAAKYIRVSYGPQPTFTEAQRMARMLDVAVQVAQCARTEIKKLRAQPVELSLPLLEAEQ